MCDTIYNKLYLELYNEWFDKKNKVNWFKKDIKQDIYLSNKYILNNMILFDIKDIINNINSKESAVGAVLLYDQIPRHYYRINNTINLEYYTKLASLISDYILDNLEKYKLSSYEICFIYLPYRHLNNLEKFNDIIKNIIELYTIADNVDKNIYKKFIIASINKIYKIKNKISIENFSNYKAPLYNDWNVFSNILFNIPDTYNFNINKNENIVKTFKRELGYIKNENIIVSLSGGVDSNVALFLIKHFNINNNNIIAVHINYNNRDCCNKELEFIKTYCDILNVKLIYRTIDEIGRLDCHNNGLRDIYENLTRNIRYDMYKQVCNLYDSNSVVMLGHNKDDCFENILTNINLKKNYNNLSGMCRLSEVDDIIFWRPLLDVDKKTITDYAFNSKIPYLEDSTPKWSNRGKIRDNIRPILEQFDKNIISSFFELNTIMNNNSQLIDNYIIPNIIVNFNYLKNENKIEGLFNKEALIINSNIWIKILLKEPFYNFIKLGNKTISYKSVYEFSDALKNFIINFEKKQVNSIKKFILKPTISINISKTINNLVKISFINYN